MSGLVTIYYDIPRQLGKEFRSYGANFVVLPSGNEKITDTEFNEIKNEMSSQKIVGMAPYRYETTKINQQPYILTGTDMIEVKKNSPFWYIEGEWATNDDENNVMIGKEISKKLNLQIGETFIIEGPKAGAKVVASKQSDSAEESKKKDLNSDFYSKKLKVKGIITTGGAEESFIFLPITLLNEILEDNTKIDSIECSIEADSKQLENLATKLKTADENITARPIKRVTQSQDIVLGKLQALVLLVNIVVLILTMISVSTTMMAVVAERRKEIGLKKALGAYDSEIKKEFLGEGSALGFIGGLLGVGLGFVFAQEVSLSVFGRAIEFQWLFAPITINVSKIYGDLHALKDVSFTIRKGEWVAIMGSSGSGKSTIMNIIGCMDKPTMGEVILDGQDITKESQTSLTKIRREKIGLIFQQFHLIPYLTALENVMVAQYYHSIPDEQEALQALERVGLKDRAKHLPSQLSGGEQQRVCIARALINSPEIILADEPTGNLDEVNEKIVIEILKQLHKEGATIVVVTHDLDVGNVAERKIILEYGKIVDVVDQKQYGKKK